MASARIKCSSGCATALRWCDDERYGTQEGVIQSSSDPFPGKLLTTPSHLLKLVVPLTTIDQNSDRKDVEPLALLVHPKQPLSYLERLIQSELPSIKTERGAERVPTVRFRAEDSAQDEITPKKKKTSGENVEDDPGLSKSDAKVEEARKPARGDGSVERYSGLGREHPDAENSGDRNFVRWSSSTEVGDFIRDAARGKEFAIEIEGASREIRIAVPSFNDRTFYLRQRLRKTSTKIADMASIKRECDLAAHKSAQRVAVGGAGLLVGYWYLVYRLTFETDLGWDTMEPVTVSHSPERTFHPPHLTKRVVPSWTLHFDMRLPLVPLPQPRGLIPFCSQPYHQPPPDKALPVEGF